MGSHKVLVTGGAGFIGSHVVDALIKDGFKVVVVDDLSTGKRENISQEAGFYALDIQDQRLSDIFKKERPSIVIHHAAQVSVRDSVDDPVRDASINILGSINLLENSVKNGVEKFLFASTGGAIYGEQDYFPADEHHPLRPISPYGVAKLSVERYLYFYKTTYGLDYVSLRYANVFGPRQDPFGEAGVVAIFSQKMIAGDQPIINGDGDQTRDFVYVEDVARANILAMNDGISGIYNIGTGEETSVNTLFALLKRLTGASIDKMHGPPKKGEQLRSVLDYGKAEKDMGWKPEVKLYEGLRRTVEYFRSEKGD